ncbi:MAG: LysM peptidoglycan-binding domain-containing protein [Butyrivibrio sp.]|nr:LysM peptidoglycan-binding domain-containing protein [Butyrivibrio sp.]
MKKYVTKRHGKKCWLTPLAFFLIFSLVICPIGMNTVYAGEVELTEKFDAFWAAINPEDGSPSYWDLEEAFYDASEKLWGTDEDGSGGAMKAYDDAVASGSGLDAARNNVKKAVSAYETAYNNVKSRYDEIKSKYDALSDDEKGYKDAEDSEATTPTEDWTGINSDYNGEDGNSGIKGDYETACGYIDEWEAGDKENSYWDASSSYWESKTYWSAKESLMGVYDEEAGASSGGALAEYEEAVKKGSGIDAARTKTLSCIAEVEKQYKLAKQYYESATSAYNALPDSKKSVGSDIYKDYNGDGSSDVGIKGDKANIDNDYADYTAPAIAEWKKENPDASVEESETTGSKSETTAKASGNSDSVANSYNNYIKDVEKTINTAQANSTVKIVTKDSVTLTSSVMKTLVNNPTISLYLEYRYKGKDYKVLIPAGKARVVEGIEYYGPLYLYGMYPYDGQTAITGSVVPVAAENVEYTVVKGDTLSKIAKKYNIALAELVKQNQITNPNKIKPGQKIVIPAK